MSTNRLPGEATILRKVGAVLLLSGLISMEAKHQSGTLIILPAHIHTLTIAKSGIDDDDVGDLNIKHTLTISGTKASSTIIEACNKQMNPVYHVQHLMSCAKYGIQIQVLLSGRACN